MILGGEIFGADTGHEREFRLRLGRRLKQARTATGMTMVALGQASQCSPTFLGEVESGTLTPSLPMLHRLSRALGIEPRSLLE